MVAPAVGITADAPTPPDTATLHAVADHLKHTIAHGEPEQAKDLLAILIAELRVNSRAEVLPTYRLDAPTVCGPTSSVEPAEVNANRCAPLTGGRMSLAEAGETQAAGSGATTSGEVSG